MILFLFIFSSFVGDIIFINAFLPFAVKWQHATIWLQNISAKCILSLEDVEQFIFMRKHFHDDALMRGLSSCSCFFTSFLKCFFCFIFWPFFLLARECLELHLSFNYYLSFFSIPYGQKVNVLGKCETS